jgi:hypothetical protein
MKYISLFLAICLIALVGCTKDESVLIRVKNISPYDFTSIQVLETKYGNLNSNQTSDYKSFETAYNNNYIELSIGSDTLDYSLIDFVGPTILKPGKYTYKIDVIEFEGLRIVQPELLDDQE